MKKKRQIRIALGLAWIFIISIWTTPVYANRQNPLPKESLDITSFDGSTTLQINWSKPAENEKTYDSSYVEFYKQFPEGYDVYVKNITQNESYGLLDSLPGEDTLKYAITPDIYELVKGRLYSFKVEPFHYHQKVSGGYTSPREKVVPTEKQEIAVMTDLDVEASVHDNKLFVQWDDPTYDNQEKIEYALFYKKTTLDTTEEGTLKFEDFINTSVDATGRVAAIGVKRVNPEQVRSFSDQYKIDNPDVDRDKMYFEVEADPNDPFRPDENMAVLVLPYTAGSDPLLPNTEGLTYGKNPLRISTNPYVKIAPVELVLNWSYFIDKRYIYLQWAEDSMKDILSAYTIQLYKDGQPYKIVTGNKTIVPNPGKVTQFQIRLFKDGVDIDKPSNVLEYNPQAAQWEPVSPEVPDFIPVIQKPLDTVDAQTQEEILQKIGEVNDGKAKYLLGEDDSVQDQNPLITVDPDNNISIDSDTFHVTQDPADNKKYLLNLVWGAFRYQTDDGSNETKTLENMEYDIYITDDIENISNNASLDPLYTGKGTEFPEILKNPDKQGSPVIGYQLEADQYQKKDPVTKQVSLLPIRQNQWYYIKIAAKINQGTIEDPDYKIANTIRSFYITIQGDIVAPPVMKRPPLGIKEVQETSATVYWPKTWVEYLNSGKWTPYEEAPTVTNPADRKIEMGDDVVYFGKLIPNEEYVAGTIKESDVPWTLIHPSEDQHPADPNGEGLSYLLDNLDSNTSYRFYIQALRNVEGLDDATLQELITDEASVEKFRAALSTTVLITTLPPAPEDIPEEPSVPYLLKDTVTDTTITVKWAYDSNFTYTLYQGDTNDFASAKALDMTVSSDEDPVKNGYYYKTQEQLYPDTTYYYWLEIQNSDGTSSTKRSNVLEVHTNTFPIPDPPQGLGLKSYNGQPPRGENGQDNSYLTLAWVRDPEDQQIDQPVKQYSYVLEVSDNPYFENAKTVEVTDKNVGQGTNTDPFQIFEKTIVQVNTLKASQNYYIRVKTVVTVEPPNKDRIVKESKYTKTIKLLTLGSTNEYDGDLTGEGILLPDTDYESFYDPYLQRLTYRIRSNKEDQEGNADYHVEQRFITRLINQGIYTLSIDVSQYEDKVISDRMIEIPSEVIKALQQRKIDVQILTDVMGLTIPYESFSSESDNQYTQIQITNWTISQYEEHLNQYRAYSTVQEVTMGNKKDFGFSSVAYTQSPLHISIKKEDSYMSSNESIQPYVYDPVDNVIKKETEDIKQEGTTISFDTHTIGAYGLLEKQMLYNTKQPTPVSQEMQVLTSSYNIIGPDNGLDPRKTITHGELSKLLLGIGLGQDRIDLNKGLSLREKDQIQKSGLGINHVTADTPLTREQAIPLLAKFYEMEWGRPIATNSQDGQYIEDLTLADPQYQQDLLKAWTVGLFSGPIQPKAPMKMEEAFALLYQILKNTGKL